MEYAEEAEATGDAKPADLHQDSQKNTQRKNNYMNQPEGEALDDEEDYKDIQKTLGQLQEPSGREAVHNPFKNRVDDQLIEPGRNP